MSLFRSEQMGYFSLVASREFVWEIFNEIGKLESLQFLDLNAEEASFNRPFSNYVKRCEEIEIKIKSIEDYINKFGKKVIPCEDYQEFLRNLRFALASRNKSERTYLDEMESELNQQMVTLGDQIKSYEELVDRYNHLIEFREVLNKTRAYVSNNFGGPNEPSFEGGFRRDIRFTYLAGVINKEDSLRFRRILFRITRGMAWTSLMDIEPTGENGLRDYFIDSAKVDAKPKTVFLIIYQGGEHQMLQQRLNRICDSFGASKYGVPEDANSLSRKLMEVENQIKDAHEIVRVTRGHLENVLDFFASPGGEGQSYSHLEGLKLFILKEKAVYHNLNMLRPQMHIYQGNCWCPLENVHKVREVLSDLARRKGDMGGCEFREASPPAGVSPPTAFRTNSFTSVFQEIVNTYGIPRYREINPGLFTIATFPFLFGVMFGDIIHGALLCIAGLYMCFWKEKIEKDKDSLFRMALPARYILAMQGFFAFYCGLIYNDMTSIPLNIFGSCYEDSIPNTEGELPKASNCNYSVGIDPAWYGTSNELTFINSFKMKLAIVLGVTHMLFGILLRGLNNIFTRKWLDFIFEFVPMLIFMSVTFGYMVFLIFLKWSLPWGTEDDYAISQAPSIINIFIKMALSPGSWDSATLGRPLYGDDSGSFQASLQALFLAAALICAVLILLPKPLILRAMHNRRAQYGYSGNDADFTVTQNLLENSNSEDNQVLIEPQVGKQKDILKKAEHGEIHAHGEHFDMSEIFVHQIIETIEFVLGSISNTASYLRLWALSLAHSQLSKVFFVNALGGAMASGNMFMAFFAFWIFANISLGVLMLMDQMECFLHALRLHWVEFQNKFYKADGYAFEPFSFEKSFKKSTSN